MARPALSASRSLDVIDLLSSFPARTFTMSEIAQMTGINLASCHSLLAVLVERRYLVRDRNRRSYALGPILFAAGQAALESQPLLMRAREGAELLFRELGVPVLLTARVGREILGMISLTLPGGSGPGLGVGQRIPLRPPVGGPFLAWGTASEIRNWIRSLDPTAGEAFMNEQDQALAEIRKRGYLVTLATPAQDPLAALIGAMASSRTPIESRKRMPELIDALDRRLPQPTMVDPKKIYNVMLIAAPIFDEDGQAMFSLCLGGSRMKLTGAQIGHSADRLVRTCLNIMRGNA